MKDVLSIGIDVGSTTVKMVVMNKNKNILYSVYERHYSDTKRTIKKLFDDILSKFKSDKFSIIMTGSGAISLATFVDLPFVQDLLILI